MRTPIALRTLMLGISLSVVIGSPARAVAQTKAACANAYEKAQLERQRGHLRAAREQMLTCSHATCPAVLQRDCLAWLRDVESIIPSFVVEAIGPDGRDTLDVKTTCDGSVMSERLDGRAMSLDPGMHVCVFEMAGSETRREEQIVLREGEARRRVRVSFESASPRTTPSSATPSSESDRRHDSDAPHGPIPASAWILGGAGIVAIGLGTFFEVSGFSTKADLDRCRPDCQQSDVDAARTAFIAGDLTITGGIILLGIAAFVALTSGGSSHHAGAAPLGSFR